MNLKELIKQSNKIVAFTGAGLSTESGIPDFRSTSGLYLSGEFENYNPQQILSLRMFRTNKEIFFRFYKQRIMSMTDKQPNRSHFSLKILQDMGKLDCVINQNIDNLLQLAGVKNVLDLHGNISQFRCISCNKQYTGEQFMSMEEVPKCDCGGIIRPNTVLFDEWLPEDIFDAAYHKAKSCDLMISIGSSLVVRPACSLLSEISPECKLVIINKDETPYDKKADLVIRENCGDVLENLVKEMIEQEKLQSEYKMETIDLQLGPDFQPLTSLNRQLKNYE